MTTRFILLGSLRSPYCRKVMILAHELGLAPPIELIAATVGTGFINTTVQRWNPLGKVPVLITDDGRSVYDSLVICLYLERLCGGLQQAAPDSDSTLLVMQWHALGQGLTDVLLQWNRERARAAPKRTEGYAAILEAKVFSAFDALEQMTLTFDAASFGLGHAAIASALGYLDFRFQEVEWRAGHPRLRAWFERSMARPSCASTKPS
jgi:glutathione S-transferase